MLEGVKRVRWYLRAHFLLLTVSSSASTIYATRSWHAFCLLVPRLCQCDSNNRVNIPVNTKWRPLSRESSVGQHHHSCYKSVARLPHERGTGIFCFRSSRIISRCYRFCYRTGPSSKTSTGAIVSRTISINMPSFWVPYPSSSAW
ncbi:uncharacterized protein EV420DRAFT_400887 [Desarmillaria tabescens]|uniref:Uncharacterized protein n=1 Tax=Armillaria tabescens TaxID=1929756 RepID=A0AA39KDR1_ARMTA|nr:uncharacterized protein EV420DRAFT_400887 [Desarmillaria tabescens]KAK0457914.1 hypothetical protein EV420DRAFT_400887 [Desarmillaria tabescens]